MKSSLSTDFTISVKHQIWEELPEVAHFYQGIYSVTLNFLLTIMFVPEIKDTLSDLSIILPQNVEHVCSEREARLFTIALSEYTVTPNSFLAGQQKLIYLPSGSENGTINNSEQVSEKGVIFYISPDKFAVFSQELSELAEQTIGVHDYVRISELKNLQTAQFILSDIIKSNNFSPSHLKYLGREFKTVLR